MYTFNTLLFQKSNVLDWLKALEGPHLSPPYSTTPHLRVELPSTIPPDLEKALFFSVSGELVLMPLSRRDIYSLLDFLPGRLEPDESGRLHWGISARSRAPKTWEGCGSREECGGVPALAVQTPETPPFSPSPPLALNLPQFQLNLPHWRDMKGRYSRKAEGKGCVCCCVCARPYLPFLSPPIILLTSR